MMTPGEFRDLRSKFDDLLALPESERGRRLNQIASQNRPLGAELALMFEAHAAHSSVLDHSLAVPVPQADAGVKPGSSFGPYRLEKELGRGGMGVVYLASRADGSFQKRVAIKILRRDRVDAFFLPRFHREREILAQLDHPHIAAIVDAGTSSEGDPYFVMEYVDGVPVTAYCRRRALSVRQKLELFLQICDAVQHAHRNLTVHRDLKPSNILVTEAGAVKLLDFGIAKLLQPTEGGAADAATTVAILTPEYASPEQIRNEPVSTAADVFSLGVLLYEMLAGEHPFHGRGRLPHEVMRAIAEDDPPLRGVMRGELQAIVLTALRKEPAWRYPSVEQLAGDVSRYLRGLPVSAKGNRWPYRLSKFARRQWLPLTATALLIAALAGGIVSTKRQAAAAERARALEAQERQIAVKNERAAEASQRIATEQRALADARAKEAEAERQKERERYRDVRSLAASLLFELHDGIRDLAGSTTARRLMVQKAEQQLEMLNADSENDPGLKRDLAAAYERMGELRIDPGQARTGAAAALDAYRRGVSLRRALASGGNAAPADRRDLALSLSKLGDGEFFAGDPKQAAAEYQQAWSLAKALVASQTGDASMPRALGTIDERRCTLLLAAGNTAGAMEACREGIATLAPLAKSSPNEIEIQRAIATTETAYANALRLSGNAGEAAQQAAAGKAAFDRLQTLAPSNAEYRRLASTNETILAASLAASGDQQGSLDAFRRSVHAMEIALEIDPADLNSPLRLAVTLLGFSRRLAAGGNKTAAHDAAGQAVRLLDQTASRPGAGPVEWNEYADALLKTDFPDLTQPAKALQLARNAVAATNRKNPFFLDTMAWAYFRTGDPAKAAETEREALSLVPADAKGGLHDELQHGLDAFLEAKEF
jgi:tRNA A-37 threonylcarbamoyl transferase component Bud32